MKCYNHNDRDAVATCMECGVGLCRECADKYESVLCDKCFEKKSKMKRFNANTIYE